MIISTNYLTTSPNTLRSDELKDIAEKFKENQKANNNNNSSTDKKPALST